MHVFLSPWRNLISSQDDDFFSSSIHKAYFFQKRDGYTTTSVMQGKYWVTVLSKAVKLTLCTYLYSLRSKKVWQSSSGVSASEGALTSSSLTNTQTSTVRKSESSSSGGKLCHLFIDYFKGCSCSTFFNNFMDNNGRLLLNFIVVLEETQLFPTFLLLHQ